MHFSPDRSENPFLYLTGFLKPVRYKKRLQRIAGLAPENFNIRKFRIGIVWLVFYFRLLLLYLLFVHRHQMILRFR